MPGIQKVQNSGSRGLSGNGCEKETQCMVFSYEDCVRWSSEAMFSKEGMTQTFVLSAKGSDIDSIIHYVATRLVEEDVERDK